jgi:hypothetical protein
MTRARQQTLVFIQSTMAGYVTPQKQERFKLLRAVWSESDDDPYELPVTLSQKIGRTNRERREFHNLCSRLYEDAVANHLELLAEIARGK